MAAFDGPNPITEACKMYNEFHGERNPDLLLEMLENDAQLRKKVCAKHPIVKYVLEGIGFNFPADEKVKITDPEAT